MFGKRDPEVLVVGAGPVGLMTALVLSRRGVRTQIVDEAWRPTAHAYALALHPQSLDLLASLGLVHRVLDTAERVRTIGVYDGPERRAALDLTRAKSAFPFVAVLRQSVLEELLVGALAERGVQVQWNHRLARLLPREASVDVTIDALEKDQVGYAVMRTAWCIASSADLRPAFVVGADGHASLVRRRLDVEFPSVGRAQHFAVFEFETDFAFEHELRVMLRPTDANVVWPLPNGRCRFSFEIPEYDDPTDAREKSRNVLELGAGRYPLLEESNLRELLAARAPWFDGKIGAIDWRLVVRFERRLAKSFGSGRVWLAGDAAHMTSPVGIQSMNVGLREAHDLATAIADRLKSSPDASGGSANDALAEWGAARALEWRGLLGLEGRAHVTDETPKWLRPYAEELLLALPASGDELAELASQIGLSR
ncbi:MAG: FAD-dependent monooxygenase [Planctomycetes bacterium]|nr:FAD-dependent monooxygenase [Planctomycetota bacterium]